MFLASSFVERVQLFDGVFHVGHKNDDVFEVFHVVRSGPGAEEFASE
jgi:hypothetical protein